MTPNYCQRHGFHLCQTCDTPTAIFTCQSHLKQHITKKHNRVETNSKLVANIYRHTTPENEANWKASLSYLFNLELTPPPFRRTTWHKLKQPIRAKFYNVYNNVVSWIIDASPIMSPAIIRDNRPPQHECDSGPFWKLLLMLEPMLLAPIKGTVHLTYSNAFKARLSMFKQGRIEELHQTTWNPTPLPPTHHRHRSTKSKQQQQRRQQQHQTDNKLPTWRLRSAQQAADLGNYRAAFQRLTTNTPTATLTPPRIQRCKNELFPPPSTTTTKHTSTRTNRRASTGQPIPQTGRQQLRASPPPNESGHGLRPICQLHRRNRLHGSTPHNQSSQFHQTILWQDQNAPPTRGNGSSPAIDTNPAGKQLLPGPSQGPVQPGEAPSHRDRDSNPQSRRKNGTSPRHRRHIPHPPQRGTVWNTNPRRRRCRCPDHSRRGAQIHQPPKRHQGRHQQPTTNKKFIVVGPYQHV